MNQPAAQPTQPQPTSPATTPQDPIQIKNPGKIKKIILTIIVLIILILGLIIGLNLYKKNQIENQVLRGKSIVSTIYDVRTEATTFYQSNHSYKDWWPNSQYLIKVSQLGSTIIFRKPDFQNYLVYAYIPSDQKFFCLDSYQFAGYLSSISDNQIKCQP